MAVALVTGATGNVGNAIARALVADGRRVRALVRDPERARPLLPAACELVRGDVTVDATLPPALQEVECVFHAAGLPEQWLADPATFERVNVGGTESMLRAARAARVARFVYTSTIDVFAWRPGVPFDESVLDPAPKHTHYERSKQAADRMVQRALEEGLPAVLLHPSAVYGTSPTTSPGVNDLLKRLIAGEIPLLLPGTMPIVFADDVARGHLLAERAAPGSRFILSESVWTLPDLAREMAAAARDVLGVEVRLPGVLPRWVARGVSIATEGLSAVTRRPPLLPAGQLEFLLSGATPVSDRARSELGWRPRAAPEGLRATLRWLVERGEISPAR
ncbi:MAG: NAD-dependent epimerase/dehydratase family protein [Thermodesulfobacteriota bacterium]